MAKKKILMIMPSLPWPETGAEQSDRAWGIRLLKELGHEVPLQDVGDKLVSVFADLFEFELV